MARCSTTLPKGFMRFKKEYDIIVGGGGIAGVAAALEAARSGMKVALIEKTVFPGGLATTGMVNIYLPLCDGNGTQIIYGIAEELLKISVEYSPAKLPSGWGGVPGEKKSRYLTRFSPASFILALDKVLEEAELDIWYDSLICDVAMEENKVTGIIVENKSGRGLLTAECVIDATGDADIAAFAGAELQDGNNKLSIWGLQANLEKAAGAVKFDDPEMLMDGIRLGADDDGRGHPEGHKTWDGINGWNVTEFILMSRKLLREHYEKQEAEKGGKAPFPLTLPAMAQFRTTRKIVGLDTVLNENENKDIPNAIGSVPDWRSAGRIWQVPYGALVPKGIKGLLTAGRIISVEDGDAWNVCRVIPAAAFTGQLAAKAAVVSIKEKISTHEVHPDQVKCSL